METVKKWEEGDSTFEKRKRWKTTPRKAYPEAAPRVRAEKFCQKPSGPPKAFRLRKRGKERDDKGSRKENINRPRRAKTRELRDSRIG